MEKERYTANNTRRYEARKHSADNNTQERREEENDNFMTFFASFFFCKCYYRHKKRVRELDRSENQTKHEEELHLVSNGVCLLFVLLNLFNIS